MMKSKDDLKVTVVMAAYREKEVHIRKAIESILCQTMTDFELIVILDDPDNIALKSVIEEYVMFDDRISIYVNEENLGPSFSRNRGIMLAKSEYIAIMDGDDVAKSCRLEKQLNKIQEDRIDIVGGYVTVIDDMGNVLYCMTHLPLSHDKIAEKMKINNCIPHSTCFMKKNVYLALNGYADILCEDYDFLLRAIKAGYKLGMVNEILLDYRLSEKGISRNNLYEQYLMMQYLQDKYFAHQHNDQSYDELYEQKYSDRRAQKYAKAALHFENALSYKSRHQYIKMIIEMFRVIFGSKDYCIKIIRYLGQNG